MVQGEHELARKIVNEILKTANLRVWIFDATASPLIVVRKCFRYIYCESKTLLQKLQTADMLHKDIVNKVILTSKNIGINICLKLTLKMSKLLKDY